MPREAARRRVPACLRAGSAREPVSELGCSSRGAAAQDRPDEPEV